MNEINSNQRQDQENFFAIKKSFMFPFLMILVVLLHHVFYKNYATVFTDYVNLPYIDFAEKFIYFISLELISHWFLNRLTNGIIAYLLNKSFLSLYQPTRILLPFFRGLSKTTFGLSLIHFVVAHLGLPAGFSCLSRKANSVLIIGAISWNLFQLVDIAEQLLLNYYKTRILSALRTRKLFNQTLTLKRISSTIILVLSASAMLMLFENVQALSVSVLTTAGILGLILTFTARR